ncbi:hypothetical protein C3747_248g40 [Trypanosoma cruzi]|uniref:Uncharacterized protein n=1 Tax=Trypanosoma cruzi TaxID=5693 RepID=A0A2V2VL26_TRYCR|nr:hypothetical protein C3747_248g40 [Trypanosoma cruzi]
MSGGLGGVSSQLRCSGVSFWTVGHRREGCSRLPGCGTKKIMAMAENFLLCLVDTVLDVTLTLQGSQMLREYCAKLLERPHLSSSFIQRVALWWAAVEKRTGNLERAHMVMEACCKSQDPNSVHGCVFWTLWESICTAVSQFEGVHKRKQQVALQYAGELAPSAEASVAPKVTQGLA